MQIKIGRNTIGEDLPPFFIADIASNHDGDLTRAFRLIELAKESGADAVKFQNFQAPKIISKAGFEALGVKLSHQAKWKDSVYEVYRKASIPLDWTKKLKKKCDDIGIEYFSSPYDFESVDSIEPYVNIFKIGSGDITWLEIIEYIAKKAKPVILSSGASSLEDVRRAMDLLLSITKDIILMQCNTNYTDSAANFKFINLNVLNTYRKMFPGVILGLSDHTHGCASVLGAIALGARVFEKHFTDDNGRTGPDHKFSMTPQTWKEMIGSACELYQAVGSCEKKIEENEKDTVILQRRSLRFVKNFPRGHILKQRDLFPLRPAPQDSIAPFKIKEVIGKRLKRGVLAEDYLRWRDVA